MASKKGTESVGVQRQWCGSLGKAENCQAGIYRGYVPAEEHTLADVRLYIPKSWAKDRKRRKKCKVPKNIRYKTRHQLAVDMLGQKGHLLPHAWPAGDDEMGRSSAFRRKLRKKKEQYLLAVPSNTLIRGLETGPLIYSGRGVKPKTRFVRVGKWRMMLSKDAWETIDVRDGEKGPLQVKIAKCRVQAKTDRRPGQKKHGPCFVRGTKAAKSSMTTAYPTRRPQQG